MKKLNKLKFLPVLIFLWTLQGCGLFSPVSYYDPTTYRNLTELKVYTMFLYDSFMENSVDQRDVRYVKIRLAQTLEYEKGKGEPNKKTADQIKLIIEEFEDAVANRIEQGKWNQTQRDNAFNNINKLFDTAISSEMKKNEKE